MISWWQYLPQHIDPIAFFVGSFAVRFYSLFWIAGFLGAWLYLSVVLKADGREKYFREKLLDGMFWMFIGAIAGGRVGYALLYAPEYFWQHPSALFFPIESGVFTGFFGMSFFGGVLGSLLSLAVFLRQRKESFLEWTDYYVLAVPIAIFFGRIGNFFNGELYGRVTNAPWGMYFPGGGSLLRHPSQLYEAFSEGIALLFLLFFLRRFPHASGTLSGVFLLGYGVSRSMVEFFREPDRGDPLFLGFSLGQHYSFLLIMAAPFLFYSIRKRKSGILDAAKR